MLLPLGKLLPDRHRDKPELLQLTASTPNTPSDLAAADHALANSGLTTTTPTLATNALPAAALSASAASCGVLKRRRHCEWPAAAC